MNDHCEIRLKSEAERQRFDTRLGISVLLNAFIVIAEVIGGLVSGSLSLLSDALHNLTDVAALLIALVARLLARRRPSLRHTFGFHRLEVIAALFNGATLLVVATLVIREAVVRLIHPTPVEQMTMLVVATVGLVGNLVAVVLLHGHDREDLNVRAAFLHLLQDTVSSVLVVLAALLVKVPGGVYLDPIASIVVILFVVRGTYQLTRRALHILMQGTPPDVAIEELRAELIAQFGLRDVRHIHVWELGSGYHVLTAHVVFNGDNLCAQVAQLPAIREYLRKEWHIEHATLEPEIESPGSVQT
ncbi:MAG: cobalt transporter [Candidatus Sumerlaea sp.]|jgi:cobalt-zinc-cadmium efflux system protein|uniref:Cobalt-zinc-cadmium resistance protein CzcD n=1 Tax=Sumerlaea chitinivorans TaxID=2250252 RepID=A0A2Z4YAD5_SUMC1|nr:Cobalt-zinc-cadmium resistance protein CzcD [Candidatus Sumerlaea chitinivorans]GIX44667.1 MAG: cobalt transporter [Candidatus Sumerlaea sp.]